MNFKFAHVIIGFMLYVSHTQELGIGVIHGDDYDIFFCAIIFSNLVDDINIRANTLSYCKTFYL